MFGVPLTDRLTDVDVEPDQRAQFGAEQQRSCETRLCLAGGRSHLWRSGSLIPRQGCKNGRTSGHHTHVRTVEDLYRADARHVLAYALRRTDAATADDVVSEVFLIVERRLADVPVEARPWLYGVARRVLANQRRSDSRRAALQAALGVLARDPATVPAPEFEANTPLLAAIAALRPDDREVLKLTAWEGLDARDAATVLGCSPAAFYTRLHRARTRLQAELRRQTEPTLSTTATRTAP
jgi:RNA polymerase sigma factor (sigma-70 family)